MALGLVTGAVIRDLGSSTSHARAHLRDGVQCCSVRSWATRDSAQASHDVRAGSFAMSGWRKRRAPSDHGGAAGESHPPSSTASPARRTRFTNHPPSTLHLGINVHGGASPAYSGWRSGLRGREELFNRKSTTPVFQCSHRYVLSEACIGRRPRSSDSLDPSEHMLTIKSS